MSFKNSLGFCFKLLCVFSLIGALTAFIPFTQVQAAVQPHELLAPYSSTPQFITSLDGWETQNPFPQANTLNGIWGTSQNNVYSVGNQGTILQYNGTDWSSISSGTIHDLKGIWGISGTDIFVVGEYGLILHYNGTTWAAMNSGINTLLNCVWGSSTSDVYAAGSDGTILHYDGNVAGTWNPMVSNSEPYASIYAIWGSSGDDIYAGGSSILLHYTGGLWTPLDISSFTESFNVYTIWGSSSNDIFVGGRDITNDESLSLHYGNTGWSKLDNYAENFYCSWGSSGTNVFAGADSSFWNYNGTDWNALFQPSSLSFSDYIYGIWGSSSTDIFAVGEIGTIIHYNGTDWSGMTATVSSSYLNGVWGSTGDDVFAVGENGTILHTVDNGNNWNSIDVSGLTNAALTGIWGGSASDIYIVGDSATILHSGNNGGNWNKVDVSSLTSNWLNAVWGNSGNDIFAVGESTTILHYNGVWSLMDVSGLPSCTLLGIWGSSGTDVFATGYDSDNYSSVVLHYNGSVWTQMDIGNHGADLYGVWGSSATDVFVVGSFGVILHYNGTDWTSVGIDNNSLNSLYAIWGTSASDIFAAGYGRILHYNGTNWNTMACGYDYYLNAVWGTAFDNVFAVGHYGTILHGVTNSQAIAGGGSDTIQAGGSSIYVQMQPGRSASFEASEQIGYPGQDFFGMGPDAGKGLNKIFSVATDAPNGSYIALVQLHYTDAELAASGIQESNLRLHYWDSSREETIWKLAVSGNTGGTAQWMGNVAPPSTPLSPTDLGKYGIDSANNIAWAVVDHTTDFDAGLYSGSDGNTRPQGVGGEINTVNKSILLVPWLVLVTVLITVGILIMSSRHKAS